MGLKTVVFVLVDLLIMHMLIKILFGKYKTLVDDLSKLSIPINHVPLQKNKDYNPLGTFKILLLCILTAGLIVFEKWFFY
ncbi:hypothetical protein [Pedobacter sp.]|jgi:hypothetical protein|uniref:hypothetical protein n=1 Tax=Pedobacter sp. TaxID=1411316 RepID=UPI002BF1EAAB|nr:hypothetical protein [Pedobacter sp.]HEV3222012.1 hypothetical protein [Puia sp.]HWW42987.1 hypothetical protein [Pedobacter sp.]